MSSYDSLSDDDVIFVGEVSPRQTIACAESEFKGGHPDGSLKIIETNSELYYYISDSDEENQIMNVFSKLSIQDHQLNIESPTITLSEPHESDSSKIIEGVKASENIHINTPTMKMMLSDHANETHTPRTTPLKSKPNTPNNVVKDSVFKTPAYPRSNKKEIGIRTPLKNNFSHIESPVASYIKNSPIVPLIQNVRPKKPLQTTSAIPKLVKSAKKPWVSNKENTNLPSLAYRSAKETKIIDVPNEKRLPESSWAKNVLSSLPKPMIIKHGQRETNIRTKTMLSQQEDSFADLSLHQADISICTQKSALNTLKK